MKKVSKKYLSKKAERKFVALPAGNYSSEILEIVEGHSKEAYTIDRTDEEHPSIMVNTDIEPKESLFEEKTPQLIVLARINTPAKYAGRLMMQRFPLVGYQKPDGVNDDERIAKGDEIRKDSVGVDSYWVNAEGKRYLSETGTKQAEDNFGQLVVACTGENAAEWGQLFDAVDDEEQAAQCNINVTLKKYGAKSYNHWSGFFPYDESYGVEEEATVKEEAEADDY